MENFIHKSKLIIKDATLRRKILFVLVALIVFRFLANIPVPAAAGASLGDFLTNNQALGFLNILTGGGLSAISLVMLGVGPYITASIIMQLSTMMSEKLKALYHEEGEAGKKKFTQYSRLLTVPLAFVQGYGLLIFLERQGVIEGLFGFELLVNVIIIAAGSILLMWIGELISEFGIGNGVSLIIFAGIVASLPAVMGQLFFTFDVSQVPMYLGFLVAAVVIVAGVVTVTEAERPIPITYAKRVRGMKVYGGISTYLPLRVNQAGVIPIIFALSILIFPQVLVGFLSGVDNQIVAGISGFIEGVITNIWFSSILYFALVFLFTYFYTAVTFDPDAISTNLQKSGAFIPGVRPGRSTAEYIGKILTRITFVGAVFLGAIAVLPLVMQSITNVQSFAIGGTALLIVVSVVLDLVKKIDAQVTMREY
ncbi:MAG: preprotein translocase subunit SecY [Patescibacteria group bacterium]|nr:MAG: preprotein translocase subunit SecY [Patescibacteria group bacterium]